MYCSHCGAAADQPGQRYCSACGAVLQQGQIPALPDPNGRKRRRLLLVASALLAALGIWQGWGWLAIMAGVVLIIGTLVFIVIAGIKFARRYWGKPPLILGSACAALLVVGVGIKVGSGLLAHEVDITSVTVRRPVASVGLARAGAFSPDGRILATGDERGVHTWDTTTWRELSFVPTPFGANSIVLSPDGTTIAILGDAQTCILDRASGKILRQFPGRGEAAAFALDGMTLEIFSRQGSVGTITSWDLASGRRAGESAAPAFSAPHSAVAFSHDGAKLAVAGERGSIKIRDARNGAEAISLPTPDQDGGDPRGIEFSADGKKIATAGQFALLHVVDTASGRVIQAASCPFSALAAAFSPDGDRIAVACDVNTGSVNSGTVRVFDVSSGKLIFALEDKFRTDRPVWIGFSPDGTKLATPDNIWEVRPEPMRALEFSADGSKVFGAGGGVGETMTTATVRTWNASDGHEISRFTIPANYPGVRVATFSRDRSKVLLAQGGDAQVLSMADGKLLYELPDNGWGFFRDHIGSADFSPDGSRVVTGESSGGVHEHLLYIWDAQTGRKLHEVRAGARHGIGGRFSPDGSRVIVEIAKINDDTIAAWDAASGQPIYQIENMTGVYEVGLSADGAKVLILIRKESPNLTERSIEVASGSVQVRDAATGRLRNTIQFRIPGVSAETSTGSLRYLTHAFSPDGTKVIIGGGEDGTAHIWDTGTGSLVSTLGGHIGPIDDVEFSHDGSMVLTAGEDHTVRVWKLQGGNGEDRPLHILEGAPGRVESAQFSPDDRRVAASTDNHLIWVWDIQTGQGRELQ